MAARPGTVVVRCARRRRTSPTVTGMRPLPGLWGGRRGDGQAGMRQLGQRDVPVPGVVAADLVLVQAGLGRGGLEAVLETGHTVADREEAALANQHLWQRFPSENAGNVVLWKLCSARVRDTAPSRNNHAAWHERLSPGSTAVPGKKTSLGVLGEVWRVITKEPVLLTVLLSAFVIVKVIYVSQGDIQTSLGVFNSAGVATVISDGLLSAFPLISAALLALATSEIVRIRRDRRTYSFDRRQVVLLWAIWSSAAIGCFLLTPWTVAASSFILGLSFGLVTIMSEKPRIKRVLCLSLLWAASIYLVVNPLLYAVWLPHEDVTIKATDGIRVVKGYVLSDSNGWVSVLRTGQRRIYRFPSSEVTKRDLCSGRAVPNPLLPDYWKTADSPWQTIVDHGILGELGLRVHILTNKLPTCS